MCPCLYCFRWEVNLNHIIVFSYVACLFLGLLSSFSLSLVFGIFMPRYGFNCLCKFMFSTKLENYPTLYFYLYVYVWERDTQRDRKKREGEKRGREWEKGINFLFFLGLWLPLYWITSYCILIKKCSIQFVFSIFSCLL